MSQYGKIVLAVFLAFCAALVGAGFAAGCLAC